MNSIVKALKEMEVSAGASSRWNLETLCKMAALEIETKAAENARLTAAHAMQDESLVVLPRHMVNSIEEQLKDYKAALKQIVTAVEDIKIYCDNPSAWEHYDDGVSQKIRAILKAAGMA